MIRRKLAKNLNRLFSSFGLGFFGGVKVSKIFHFSLMDKYSEKFLTSPVDSNWKTPVSFWDAISRVLLRCRPSKIFLSIIKGVSVLVVNYWPLKTHYQAMEFNARPSKDIALKVRRAIFMLNHAPLVGRHSRVILAVKNKYKWLPFSHYRERADRAIEFIFVHSLVMPSFRAVCQEGRMKKI